MVESGRREEANRRTTRLQWCAPPLLILHPRASARRIYETIGNPSSGNVEVCRPPREKRASPGGGESSGAAGEPGGSVAAVASARRERLEE